MPKLIRHDLLFPELSYQIIGACFDSFNEIGPGQKENRYQTILSMQLQKRQILFKEQHVISIQSEQHEIGTHRLDFLIDEKIPLEIKIGNRFRERDFQQLASYLATSKLQLGILVRFGTNGVIFRRILNPKNIRIS